MLLGLWASSGPFPLLAHLGLYKRRKDPPPQTLAVIWQKNEWSPSWVNAWKRLRKETNRCLCSPRPHRTLCAATSPYHDHASAAAFVAAANTTTAAAINATAARNRAAAKTSVTAAAIQYCHSHNRYHRFALPSPLTTAATAALRCCHHSAPLPPKLSATANAHRHCQCSAPPWTLSIAATVLRRRSRCHFALQLLCAATALRPCRRYAPPPPLCTVATMRRHRLAPLPLPSPPLCAPAAAALHRSHCCSALPMLLCSAATTLRCHHRRSASPPPSPPPLCVVAATPLRRCRRFAPGWPPCQVLLREAEWR